MRRPLLRTGFTVLIVSALALSCREEQTTEVAKAQSPFRPTIEAYFDQLKPESEKETQHLSDLKNSIDFSDVDHQRLTDNEDMLIAGTKAPDFEKGSVVKALFYIQEGEIVRSNLVAFTNANADHNKLVMSINRRRFDPHGYNGRVTYFNIYGDVIFFNEIDQGKLTASGIAQSRPGSKAHSAGRSQGCIDWYLKTTYYYAGGGKSTSEMYMFTTCDMECQMFRINGRTQCGGGGSAASAGPSLPGYAGDGDRYIFTDQHGKTTTYLFDQGSGSWTIYLVVLPEAVVQSYPGSYPYLASDGPPADNTALQGPDNLLYIYDAWSGTWEAGLNFYYGGGPKDVITDRVAFFRCLNLSSPATLTIYVDQPKAGSNTAIANGAVGHAWLGISQTINGTTFTRVFGYYPDGPAYPLAPDEPGVLVRDAQHGYDVSVSIPISAAALSQIVNFATNQFPATYDLNTNNCTDFVVDACRAAGINLPQNESDWLGGGGLSPGQMGEDLRLFDFPGIPEQRDIDGGTAAAQSGDC